MPPDALKIECSVEIRTDYYLVVSAIVEDIPFCGILLKCTDNIGNLSKSSVDTDPTTVLPQKYDFCSTTLKKLVDENFGASNGPNGSVRINQNSLSSLCYRRTLKNSLSTHNAGCNSDENYEHYNPYSTLQNARPAKGIRRPEFRSSIRLRPLINQRFTGFLCYNCRKDSLSNDLPSVGKPEKKINASHPVERDPEKAQRPLSRNGSKRPTIKTTAISGKTTIKKAALKTNLPIFKFRQLPPKPSSPPKLSTGETVSKIIDRLFMQKETHVPIASDPIFQDSNKCDNIVKSAVLHVDLGFEKKECKEPVEESFLNYPKIPKLKIKLGGNGKKPSAIISCNSSASIEEEEKKNLPDQKSETDCKPSTSMENFEWPNFVRPKQIVWAKMHSYPYWPGQIYDIYPVEKSACVVWCASTQYGYVDVSILEPFFQNFARRYQPKRGLGYQKAIADALARCSEEWASDSSRLNALLTPQCRKLIEQAQRQKKVEGKRKGSMGVKGGAVLADLAVVGFGSPPTSELGSPPRASSTASSSCCDAQNISSLLQKKKPDSNRAKHFSLPEMKNKTPSLKISLRLPKLRKFDQENSTDGEKTTVMPTLPSSVAFSQPSSDAKNNCSSSGLPNELSVSKLLPQEKLAEIREKLMHGKRAEIKHGDHKLGINKNHHRLHKLIVPQSKQQVFDVLKQQMKPLDMNKKLQIQSPFVVPIKKRRLLMACEQDTLKATATVSSEKCKQEIRPPQNESSVVNYNNEEPTEPAVKKEASTPPNFSVPLPEPLLEYSSTPSPSESPKLVIDEMEKPPVVNLPVEKSVNITQNEPAVIVDEFDHVLNALRRMNEMCENSTTPNSCLSRY